jgi:hypothetical protein
MNHNKINNILNKMNGIYKYFRFWTDEVVASEHKDISAF